MNDLFLQKLNKQREGKKLFFCPDKDAGEKVAACWPENKSFLIYAVYFVMKSKANATHTSVH